MIKVKHTVRPYSLHIVCAFVNSALELGLFTDAQDLMITSGMDGVHGPGSVHAAGAAVDFRTKTLANRMQKYALRDLVRHRLGVAYDCILEDLGGPNEHLHVERDPSRT